MSFLRCLLILLTALSATAMAETLRDPTQLPSTTGTVNMASESSAPSGPVLQSIILSDAMRAAIINGQRINIGDAYAQSTLVAITENTATLQTADGQHTILKMPHIKFGVKQRADLAQQDTLPRVVTKTIR